MYDYLMSLFKTPAKPLSELELLVFLNTQPWRPVRICPRTSKRVSDADYTNYNGVCCHCGDVEIMGNLTHAIMAAAKWHEGRPYLSKDISALTARVNGQQP